MTDFAQLPPRRLSRADAGRMFIALLVMGAIFAITYYLLPWLGALVRPKSSVAPGQFWVIGPDQVFRFGAAAILAAFATAFLIRPIGAYWRKADLAAGSRYDPFRGRAIKKASLFIKGILLCAVYGVSLLFYLMNWTRIDSTGIQEHLPWTTRQTRYSQVVELKQIPPGSRVDQVDGPSYTVIVDSGREIDISLRNEGMTDKELTAIADFVSAHVGQPWQLQHDLQGRK